MKENGKGMYVKAKEVLQIRTKRSMLDSGRMI
jgi:hypothetical protein